jgi:hypothetical protein
VIVDTAVSLTGGRGQNPFFPTKAQIAIQTGFEVLRHMEAYVTIPNIHRLLLNEADANAAIETLMNKGDQRSHELIVALRDGFFGQPPEQLGGVQGTLSTYLEFFINPEIAEVFCANEPTFSIGEIDAGKIVCIAMPQKFQSERLYINTILKLSYYFHALSRFDKPAGEREKANLIVLFADEGQEIITGAESAFADHRAAGIIREARAALSSFCVRPVFRSPPWSGLSFPNCMDFSARNSSGALTRRSCSDRFARTLSAKLPGSP